MSKTKKINEMTYEEFSAMMKKIETELKKPKKPWVMFGSCKKYGLVKYSVGVGEGPPFCDDSECKGCRAWEDLFRSDENQKK